MSHDVPERKIARSEGMTAPLITCPSCGVTFELTEALAAPLEERLAAEHAAELARMRDKLDAEADARVIEAQRKAREDSSLEKEILRSELADERERRVAAQAAEIALRQERNALEIRARDLDLEVARRLDAEKQRLEQALRQGFAEQEELRFKEKERLIDELRAALADAKRKCELGSAERQGEVLEIDLQAGLERRYPHDLLTPVPKGARGADLLQNVREGTRSCGLILWETKNTRHWQSAWIDKLKCDQRAAGASLAVLVSAALPDDIVEFGRIQGVWVASLRAWPALALALREQLVQIAFAQATSEGRHEKTELLYRYLAGEEFRSRVEAIVEAFVAMQAQLGRERSAMTRLWKEREKQIDRALTATAGVYGEVRGILGGSLPTIAALELELDPEPMPGIARALEDLSE
jgi:hypothetical protein